MKSVYHLTLISGLGFIAIGVSSPLMTLYLRDLGASYSQLSLILTTVSATAMVSNYVWGKISDRLRRRKPLIVGGLFFLALAFTLISQVPNANWAWGVRIFEGVSMAAYTTISLALMGDLLAHGGKRGRQMGIFRGVGSFAFAVGAVIGGPIADRFSISTAMLVVAGFYLLAALVAAFLKEETSTPESTPELTPQPASPQPAGPASTATATYQRLPIFFLVGVFFWVAAHMASATMWPNYMDELGYSKTAITSLWGLAAVVEGFGMPLVGNLSDVVGRTPLLIAGGVAIALVQVGYITVATLLPALIGVQVIRGFGFASYTTTAMTFTAESGSKAIRGGNSGTYHAASSSGQLLGAMAGGVLVDWLGFTALFSVCSLAALTSAGCFWLLRTQQRRQAKRMLEVGAES